MSLYLKKQLDYQLYLKRYPSLEDLEEETEDHDENQIDQFKQTIKNNEPQLLVKKVLLKQNPNEFSENVYENVVRRDAYIKTISYTSTLTKNCLPFKGYVIIIL